MIDEPQATLTDTERDELMLAIGHGVLVLLRELKDRGGERGERAKEQGARLASALHPVRHVVARHLGGG